MGFVPPLLQRRKVFVSYHHGLDQSYYDKFVEVFDERLDLVIDGSLERRIGSDDVEYTRRAIRERFLTGTSATLVLCGNQTPQRKYVDWEIYSTLRLGHARWGVSANHSARSERQRVRASASRRQPSFRICNVPQLGG